MERTINGEKFYYYYLCKNKVYNVNEISQIDDEDVVKIGTHPLGVILFTLNYYYKFDFTIQDKQLLFTFKERFKIEDEDAKKTLKTLKPLNEEKGYSYTYTDKNLRLILGDYPPFQEKFEILNIKIIQGY